MGLYRNLKTEAKIFLMAFIGLLVFIIGIFYIVLETNETINKDLLHIAKKEIRSNVKSSVTAIKQVLERRVAQTTDEQAQLEIIKNNIDDVFYSENDKGRYFFVYKQTHPVLLPSSLNINFKGQDWKDRQDENGVFYVHEMYNQAKNGGGFTEYVFYKEKDGVKSLQPKISYSAQIKGTPYWIGTGIL